jgi:hypothetical protein
MILRLGYGRSRVGDAVIAFAVPALTYLAYFATLAATTGIGWTIHLWLGATLLAGIIGLALNELMRTGAAGVPEDS